MSRVHWINVDSTVRIEENAESPTFNAMKDFLGDNAEHVTVLYEGKRASMFVHEMGRVIGLPRNRLATEIYFAASRARGIDPVAEFVKKGTTGMKPGDITMSGSAFELPEGWPADTKITNLDPTPNEPPGIHGPAILLEGFE